MSRQSSSARGRRTTRGGDSNRRLTPAAVIASVAVVAVVAAISYAFWPSGGDGTPRAAIVDQLSLTFPNQDFVDDATSKLELAGYEVVYVPGENVTVSFYRDLPSQGYDLILFRSHADRLQAVSQDGNAFDEVILFTSEPHSPQRYRGDQAENNLVIARYRDGGEPYFGIGAGFIDNGGSFEGATIIMMGCEGLLSERTAEAFVQRGAEQYISWNETVTAAHTDAATDALLQHMLVDGLDAGQAVDLTMDELGPDPTYGSELLVYPSPGDTGG